MPLQFLAFWNEVSKNGELERKSAASTVTSYLTTEITSEFSKLLKAVDVLKRQRRRSGVLVDVQEGQRRRSGVLVDVQEEVKHVCGRTEEKK